MPGDPDNPLGTRVLYLLRPEREDTLLRIHGIKALATIGATVSNGCTRLVCKQIIDPYDWMLLGTVHTSVRPEFSASRADGDQDQRLR